MTTVNDEHDDGVTGSSATAETFGARISLPMEGRSLFYVVGRAGSPEMIVRAAGGVVVTRFPDSRRVLAIAALSALAALRHDPGIELAGPISIDAERFGQFAQLIGLDSTRGS